MTKIKLCGLCRAEDIEYANEVQPDFIGFVFCESSRRFVLPETAARLKARLSKEIAAVGVFVDAPVERVLALLDSGAIDVAQLHGSEDEAYIRALKEKTDRPVIKAFRVTSAEDLAAAEKSSADQVLLDNGAGGTGERFDWSLLDGAKRSYFLAGGLSPENVAKAIAACRPFAVDASSGLETDGRKDFEKMRRFVRAVRAQTPEGERL